jgi:hypothetical protein
MQVVVAEQGLDAAFARFAQGGDAAQRFERGRPAVDQVADKDDGGRAAGIFGDALEQDLGFVAASLQVADGVGFHGRVD